MIVIPAHPKPILVLATVIGVLLAALSPARSGAALAVLAGIGGWFACYGVHGSPPLGRVLCFAAALYLLHSSTALAAGVALSSRLDRLAAGRWSARCLLHLGIAGALIALSYPLARLADRIDPQALEIAGACGVVALLAVMVWLFSRSLR
ncbi:MAG: hypothetical protein ACR2N4_00990 [Jatrophihabitans sp.]